ncbi:MAG: response regulator receiver modulated diguanylate cyclase/phosphodiesterase with sensor(s) [Proteobacteria bacterium]|nr:response regulator receiver modulated diguanylate cyclase/phosphodiesterase with sensor(s) [Pseudomonadota bacterium]
MNDAALHVLLVEDNSDDARLIEAALAHQGGATYQIEKAGRLSEALNCLGKANFDIVLLDLSLPDGQGIAVFEQVSRLAANALILILSSADDEEVARLAVQNGADDYLVKGLVDAHWLPRTLRYLIERKTTRQALTLSEARFRAMSDASPLGIFVSDIHGECVYTNAAYHKISGLNLEQTLGTNWSMAIHPDDRQRVLLEWRAAALGEATFQTEARFLRADGSIVWARLNAAAMLDGQHLRGHVQTVEDISERKITEDALFEEKERAQVTLNSIGDAVLTTNLKGDVTYLNLVAEMMTGWPREAAIGQPLSEVFRILNGTTREVAPNPAQLAIRENRTVGLAADSILLHRDGLEAAIEDSAAPIHNRDGQVAGAVIVFHDVSESRAMALKMAHLAQHDFLTGLPNRALLTERLSRAIGQARRHNKRVGMLFLDLDYFKHINDSLGHAVGDQLLQQVAERLIVCIRDTDTVCRQGGDEFVILLAEIEQARDAAPIAEKLLAAFAEPCLIAGNELHVSLSIGISIYPDDGMDADAVMKNADTAMYHAKANGRNNYQFFTTEMNTRAVRRLFIEGNLRRALRQGEFMLYYQPKIDLASGLMIGSEALIRWQDPEHGLVYPKQFVPIAEESGLIVPIGSWVLREACRQVRAWQESGLVAVPVSVNISAVEFRHKDFLEGVALILKETGMLPSYLELELTESILMHDAESSATVLEALKTMGMQLAIDDFGTGYSSLSYLKRFPINTLKIDQSFVHDIAIDPDDASIVGAMIGMGKNLKQRVVAEGVETEEQLAFLRTLHCDEGQGFLFGRPLPADEFARLLLNDRGFSADLN